jgi:hypothetical protein
MNVASHHVKHPVRSHNAGPAAVWSSGGAAYDEISRGILDAIEHTINRLEPRPGMRVLDVATGTGWTARRLAEQGADVWGGALAIDLLAGDGGGWTARRRVQDGHFDAERRGRLGEHPAELSATDHAERWARGGQHVRHAWPAVILMAV